MHFLRAFLRALGMVILTLWYLTPILARAAIKGVDLSHAQKIRKIWAQQLMPLLGIRVHRSGNIPTKESLIFISNHRSYIDPVVALTEIKALPVAKMEVASWPLIGFAAKSTGIHFVKRESSRSRWATLEGMRDTLNEGNSVLIYPEGTTHVDEIVMPFRKGAFRLAAEEGFAVLPMAVDYKRLEDAWIGDATFLPHFFQTFGNRYTDVWIHYGEALSGEDARELVAQSEAWINKELAVIRGKIKENELA